MEVIQNPNLLWYLIGYTIVMIIIGIFSSKKVTNSEDYILAGKSLGAAVLMGTLIATWCGGGTITGGSNSLSYTYGLYPGILHSLTAFLGIGIIILIANKIREFGKYTVSEILETKYGNFAKTLSAIIIVLSYVGIVSYQFKGLGFILNVTTGMDVDLATILGAILIIFLSTIGGLISVAYTDALSAFLILLGLFIGVPVSINIAGGWSNIVSNVPESSLTLTGGLTTLQLIGYLLPSMFLLLGDQNMYQRLAASKGTRDAKIASIGWLVGVSLIYPAVSIIAFTARVTFPNIQPGMALIATTTVMPTVVGGLMLAASTAFIVTTGTSYLLSGATSVTYDLYGKYINPNASDKQKLFVTKILVPILGIISYMLIKFFPTILSIQMYAYTVYAAGITPAVLAVFLWKRVNKIGGISSMISGVITTLLWEIVLKKPYDLNSSIISVPVAVIVLVIVTLMTTKKKSEVNA